MYSNEEYTMQDTIIKYKYFAEDILLESKGLFPDLHGLIVYILSLLLVLAIATLFYKIVLCNKKYLSLRLKVLKFIDDAF